MDVSCDPQCEPRCRWHRNGKEREENCCIAVPSYKDGLADGPQVVWGWAAAHPSPLLEFSQSEERHENVKTFAEAVGGTGGAEAPPSPPFETLLGGKTCDCQDVCRGRR
eukprot:1153155-Pelagomonas_calceolata.AAC.2